MEIILKERNRQEKVSGGKGFSIHYRHGIIYKFGRRFDKQVCTGGGGVCKPIADTCRYGHCL